MKNNIKTEPTRKELNSIVRNFQQTIILDSAKDPVLDVISLIDNPFREHAGNDLLSAYFHRIYKNTPIPPALTIFTLLGFLSQWCVKNDITYRRPDDYKDDYMNLWLMLLAPQGASKTKSLDIIKDNMVKIKNDIDISPNFEGGAGSAAFFQNLKNIEDGKVFWVKDEAAQFIKQLENPTSDLSNAKAYLLEAYDGKQLTRSTKKDGEQKTQRIIMVQIFVNTIAGMLKHISTESLNDGYMRRQGIVIVRRDACQDFTEYALYKLSKVACEELADKQAEVFEQNLRGNHYTFNKESEVLFREMFKTFWRQQYETLLHGEDGEGIYRTNMQLAWKYAVLHHILHLKSGTVVDAESMEWALKVCMYHLNSFQTFVKEKGAIGRKNTSLKIDANRLEKMWQFVKENGNKSGITIRAVCRKFTISKEEAIGSLMSIKLANPKAEYDILTMAMLEERKNTIKSLKAIKD